MRIHGTLVPRFLWLALAVFPVACGSEDAATSSTNDADAAGASQAQGSGGAGAGGTGAGAEAGAGGSPTGSSGSGGKTELCNGEDDDGDGQTDEGCSCIAGETQPCYSGPESTKGIGVCKSGKRTCDLSGVFGECAGEVAPSDEVCNGKDDDCDGQVDEDFETVTCGVGACQTTVDECTNGVGKECLPGSPSFEQCNGIDDDCDDIVDEGCTCVHGETQPCYTGSEATKNVGACKEGKQTCLQGAWGPCTGDVTPTLETCNGEDDDCDGVPDDLGQTTCGTGACQKTVSNCENGKPQQCVPGKPAGDEVCNNVDDDCDGDIDEELGFATCGVGQCKQTVPLCLNGMANACQPLSPAPEKCDGADNDCDGLADEGNPGGGEDCDTGQPGVCSKGKTICLNHTLVCKAIEKPGAEGCDGLDNDCDGFVDDGNPGGGAPCETGLPGVCANGVLKCQGGKIVCTAEAQGSPEACDGQDNDCDGVADEDDPEGGQPCNTGKLGACAAGTTKCEAGEVLCVQTKMPSAEVCDGVDNDCNGVVDENAPGGGAPCETGMPGVCAKGTTSCAAGALTCEPDVPASSEVCDGLDNDCDGQVDDGNPGGGKACDTGMQGVCAAGTQTCSAGAIVCTPNVMASEEVCDGLDNDCNGAADDGDPGSGVMCSTGKKGACALGTTACESGALVCKQLVAPSAETCNATDDDCDGAVDEGNPGGGAACSTGKLGVCAAGVVTCTAGALSCKQSVQASEEVCDGKDNDCDGTVDEGGPPSVACNTGLPGVCATGKTDCSGGVVVCLESVMPSSEVCDKLDNDCDGQVDEGNPGGGAACNTGKPGVCAAGTVTCTNGALTCQQNVQSGAEICDGLDNDCDGLVDEVC